MMAFLCNVAKWPCHPSPIILLSDRNGEKESPVPATQARMGGLTLIDSEIELSEHGQIGGVHSSKCKLSLSQKLVLSLIAIVIAND